MAWCAAGPSTYPKRKAIFEERKAHVEAEIAHINRALDMLKFKCWYFVQAIAEVYLRQYVARLPLSRLDIIFIPTTLHASLFHRYPNCSVTAKWFFSYRISPSRCMRDSSLLSALRSTFR